MEFCSESKTLMKKGKTMKANKTKKRFLSLLLTVCMVLAMMPATAFAATAFEESVTPPSNGDNRWGYVSKIVISGEDGGIKNYFWSTTSSPYVLDVVLDDATPDDATISSAFSTAGLRAPSIQGDTSVTLVDGEGTINVTAKKGVSFYSDTQWTINFFKNTQPVLADGQEASAEEELYAGKSYELDLTKLFTDADGDKLTYKVKINDQEAVEADADYSFKPAVGGEYTLVFYANDGKQDSEETYTVKLTVKNSDVRYKTTINVPESVTPKFYITKDFNEDGADEFSDALSAEKGKTTDGVTAYEVSVPDNISQISVRGKADDVDLGGMAFNVEADGTVDLRQVQGQAVNPAGDKVDTTVTVTYDGNTAVAGTANNYLLAAGREYTYTAKSSTSYKEGSLGPEKLEAGSESYVAKVPVELTNAKTITVTDGAEAQLFAYNKYYDFTEIEAAYKLDNEDETTTYYFSTTKGPLSYRVSMKDKITKAGYWTSNATVLYTDEDASSDVRPDYSTSDSANAGIAEDGVFLNINGQNCLNLSVGDTKTLKSYRVWEIIKFTYQNEIISPDFEYEILSGKDVISLTAKDAPSNGNSDWMQIEALKEGIAVIEVSYDAIQISGGQFSGIYGASDPARTGLVVVQVGQETADVDFGIKCFASQGSVDYSKSTPKAWDAEFDTLYFTGNSGELELTPTVEGGTVTKVEVSNDKGDSWTELTGEEGTYTAKIVSGNNIIKVTTDQGTAYQVVRGDKVTVTFSDEAGGDGDGVVEAGETIRVTLDGLHQPIPKMAGNYNPGYGGNTDGYSSAHLNYTFNGETAAHSGAQYNFITTANYVDVTIPEDGDATSFKLTDGYIGVGIIGLTNFADGGDSHRNIPDSGCATRGSSTTFNTRSMLPEITISIGDGTTLNNTPYVTNEAASEASIQLGDAYTVDFAKIFADADEEELTYTMSIDDKDVEVTGTSATFTPEAAGTYIIKVTAKDHAAAAEHVITLTVTEKAIVPDDNAGADDDQNTGNPDQPSTNEGTENQPAGDVDNSDVTSDISDQDDAASDADSDAADTTESQTGDNFNLTFCAALALAALAAAILVAASRKRKTE